MKQIFLSIIIILAFCFTSLAQHGNNEGRGKMYKEIKAQKISFITQKLNLTPQEAQYFWPVYNELENKKDALRHDAKILFKKIRNGLDNIPENELEQISDGLVQHRVKESQLELEYHEKLKKVLPVKKVLELYHAEKQFQNMLLKKIREKGRHMGRQ